MAGLDLRLFNTGGLASPPRCSELHDTVFNFTYDDGSSETLYVDGEMYECSKLGESLFLANGRGAAFAIDTARGAVTCVALGGGTPIVTTGVFGDNTGKHELTSDLDGNTVKWCLGALRITAEYTVGSVALSGDRELSASELTAVALGDGVYLQVAIVSGFKRPVTVALLCDFTLCTCIGAILGMDPQRFSGYAGLE